MGFGDVASARRCPNLEIEGWVDVHPGHWVVVATTVGRAEEGRLPASDTAVAQPGLLLRRIAGLKMHVGFAPARWVGGRRLLRKTCEALDIFHIDLPTHVCASVLREPSSPSLKHHFSAPFCFAHCVAFGSDSLSILALPPPRHSESVFLLWLSGCTFCCLLIFN